MIVKRVRGPLTAAEFDRKSGTEGYELIDGRLEEKEMGSEASWIQNGLGSLLHVYVTAHKLGYVFDSEGSYACFPQKPGRVRKPDVSFVRYGRFDGERIPEGSITIPPDLVVEVVSPQEKAYKLDQKIMDFESVAVPLIWVVYPNRRGVQVRSAGNIRELTAADDLTGDPVLPGFRVKIADLFPPAGPVPPAAS
ncbi:MAG: Uma2 family endonuclease [Fimbriiglobus sp.]